MSAQVASSSRAAVERPGPVLVMLARSILATAAVMLLLVASLLATRRVSGVSHGPLFPGLLLVAALVLVIVVSTIRVGWWYLDVVPWRSGAIVYGWWFLSLVTLVLFAISMSVAEMGAGCCTVLWASIVFFEGGWWYALLHRSGVRFSLPVRTWFSGLGLRRAGATDSLAREHTAGAAPHADRIWPSEEAEGEGDSNNSSEFADESLLAPGVYQQVTRLKSDNGMDTVNGLLKGEFRPGQRSQSLHVAFCPPMAARPSVEVMQITGPRSSVKAADVQPYGIRFDVRLAVANQQSENVLIHFEAQNQQVDEA